MPKADADPSLDRSGRASKSRLATVEKIGALRDGLFVLAGLVYLAGYLSWTLYAFENGLGLIPALDAQFFSAGLVPAAIVVAFWYSVRVLFYVKRWLGRDLTERQKKTGTRLAAAATALILVAFVLEWILGEAYGPVKTALVMAGMVCFYAAACFSRGKLEKAFMQPIALFAAWAYLILGGCWLLYGYYYKWFPAMPQELGGPAPRCVSLDLVAARLSEKTRLQLGGLPAAAGVYRSPPLNLIFRGGEFAIIEKPAGPNSKNLLFRIRTGAVESIFPCEATTDDR